jgi:hypothetical protein
MLIKKPGLSRRTILRGMLGGAAVSVGLPLLEAFLNDTATAHADGAPLPKRFGIFFWGNGVLPDRWVPAGTGPDWEPSPILMPLAGIKKKLSVVSGMKVYTGNTVPHGSGPVGLLSGAPFPAGDTSTFAKPSIDQVIANEIGGDTRFRSLELGVERSTSSLSYNGPHSINPQEASPIAFFQRVFGPDFTLPGDTPKIDPKLALRRSVLDAVQADAARLQMKLGAVDKARLDQHMTGIRELEMRLLKFEQNPPMLAACSLPKQPSADYPDIDGRPQLSAVSRVMADTLALALACDQSRVFSMWFSTPVDNVLYPSAKAGHHQLTHDEPDPQPQVQAILTFIMTELAYFLGALDGVKEGDGTLLDNCAVLCTTDCSLGRSHSVEDYPILVAGTAGGALKTGLHYRSPANENTSKAMLSLVRAMGISADHYGEDTGRVTDSLGAIEV